MEHPPTAAAAAVAPAQVLAPAAAMGGEVIVLPPESEIGTGSGDGPGAKGFVNPSDGGGQQCLHSFWIL